MLIDQGDDMADTSRKLIDEGTYVYHLLVDSVKIFEPSHLN